MIVLDTNVISALMLRVPDQRIVAWVDRQPRASVWTTSVTVLEIRLGLQSMPAGKRRTMLIQTFDALRSRIEDRVASFDTEAAERTAGLMAAGRGRGRPIDLRDAMIAGIVLAHRAALATRNTSHFQDLGFSVIDPWIA